MIETLQNLDDLVYEIQSLSCNGKWFLPTETLIQILGVSSEIFYKKAYSLKNKNYKFDVNWRKGFNFSEVENLIYILEGKNFSDLMIKNKFISSGIYLGDDFIRLFRKSTSVLIEKFFENHKIDKNLLNLYIDSTQNFDDAINSYLSNIDLKELSFEVSINFLKYQNIYEQKGIQTYLEDFLYKTLTTNSKYLYDCTRKFREKAYYNIYGKHQKNNFSQKKKQLFKFFQLSEKATKSDLKKSFNQMLKKYHPDLNDQGEDITKKILSNYRLLIKIW